MPWQNDGGGRGGPWGGPPRNGDDRRGGPRRGGGPIDFEEIIRRGQDQVRRHFPGRYGGGGGILLIVAALVGLWLLSGFFIVRADEQGIVLRFGAYNRTAPSGWSWHIPAPVESVLKPKVTRVNRVEVGFRASEGGAPGARAAAGRQVPEEALMLTGDENIVDINFTVFWLIKDAQHFLFNIRNPEATVKAAAESAMRESIGRTPIASALAEGRGQVETDTKTLLQGILDTYGAGIEVTQVQLQKVDPPAQVIDAFRDVQRARADQERLRNEAEAYRNDILPRARGEAVRLVQEAEAYKQEVVARSQGDAERFLSVFTAYQTAPDVTERRIYLETMEEILKGTNKIVIDKAAQGAGVLPYLPLPELGRRAAAPPPRPGAPPTAPPGAAGTGTPGASTSGGVPGAGAARARP
jgi:modulator of FtsH protease HflK